MTAKTFCKSACRHCGGNIEYPIEAAGMSIPCPHCQESTVLPVDSKGLSLRRGLWLTAMVLLLGGAGWGGFALFSRWHSASAHSPLIPDPPPADLQRLEQLAFWDFAIEQKEGSSITHAVARVVNESQRTRYGIEVQLELFDELGQPAGAAKDYLESLEPGQDSHIRALVVRRGASSARVLQITEQ